MMKLKSILFIIIIFLAASALALAGGIFQVREPVTLTFWHVYGSDAKESPMSVMIDVFNKGVGAEKDITVDGAFILESQRIDASLMASVRGEPGANAQPDIFTAYPRMSLSVGTDLLLDWRSVLSDKDLSRYNADILRDGTIDGAVFGLPIAKSTEVIFLNATAFDKLAAECGITRDNLSTFDGLFRACVVYAGHTGRTLLHMNDFYNYLHAAVTSMGGKFVIPHENGNAKLDLSTQQFERAFLPLARAAAAGGLSLYDGFASVPWKTEDIIVDIGSSAGLIYLREYVTRPDNTRENIETVILPYPVFEGAEPTVVMRGAPLYAFRRNSRSATDETQRIRAAAEFAKWITTGEPNMRFALSAGYLPVTDEGLDALKHGEHGDLSDARAAALYRVYADMRGRYRMIPLPLYSNITEIQPRLERAVRQTLLRVRAQCQSGDVTADEAALRALSALRMELMPVSAHRYVSGE